MSILAEPLSASEVEEETPRLDVEEEKCRLTCSFQSYSPPLLETTLETGATYPWTRQRRRLFVALGQYVMGPDLRRLIIDIGNGENSKYERAALKCAEILSTYLTMRPAILRDLERLYELHHAFKMQLEKTTRFDLYEAFIRSFDVLAEDITILRKNHPADGFWTEGIEALQKSMHSSQRRKENHKKSMTMDDLIAKPVQRVCKYRLLLSELLKTIPQASYPWAYSEIEKILDKNVQAVERINTVVGDPNLRIRIGKTVSLHERLNYDGQTVLENVYQELGPLILCGVLHVVYHHSLMGITGQYLVCILFPGYFVIAKPRSDTRKITLVASIYLSDMTVDTPLNGQGIACPDTPFSWKVIFQHDQKRYELIFSGSSVLEERGWKTEILRASMMPPNEVPTISLEPRRFSFASIPLKPLESDGRPLRIKRRVSIQTLSSGLPLQQEQEVVIIKKTHNPLHDNEVRLLHEAQLTRSRSVAKQSVCTPIILMTARLSRVKLERSIADIFSDEILPYPGMTLGRSDYLQSQAMMRRSVIRGLSLRGVFGNRRSASLGKATSSLSVESSLETQKQEGQDKNAYLGVKEAGIVGAAQGTPEKASDSKDIVDDYLHDTPTKTALHSIRQRKARAVSDNVTDETGGTKPKSKPRVVWKRLSLSILGFFDTTNNYD
ncbi:hypothetical protein UA08_03305 [Talaromyces atroroseus]|uniref:DH domain-containing protein n=1 Tax=Talaromyces atroroseus TaxID=1441469 RepID=A0A225AU86_TALAT|nr:hypothetical protein UA08_03305 [Talaromyces atroroseus]OKL60858.1 hypothetical protein UA08_03305 [Talaromyces atroroseus]